MYDEVCFALTAVDALNPSQVHTDRTASYSHYAEVLNSGDITFSIKRQDNSKFKKLNNLSVNVYVMDKN